MSPQVAAWLTFTAQLLPWLRLPVTAQLFRVLVGQLVARGFAKELARSLEDYVDGLIPASITGHVYTPQRIIRKAQIAIGGPLDGAAIVGTREVKMRLAPGVRAELRLPVVAQGRRVVVRHGSTRIPGFPGWDFYYKLPGQSVDMCSSPLYRNLPICRQRRDR